MKKIITAGLVVAALAVALLGTESAHAYWVGSGYKNANTAGSFGYFGKTIAWAVGPALGVPARAAATANVTVLTPHYAEVRCGIFPFYWYQQGPQSQGVTVGGPANNSQTNPCPAGQAVNPFGGGYLWF